MKKAKQSFGGGRLAWFTLLGSLPVALAACGGTSGSAAPETAAAESNTSAAATTTATSSTTTPSTDSTSSSGGGNVTARSTSTAPTPPPAPAPTTAPTTAGDNFPRLGIISTEGPQKYASSFQTFAAKFHMVIVGGTFEHWEENVGYSKESVIKGIKSQSNVNTRVFQYVELNSLYNSGNAKNEGFPTLANHVKAMKWWLYSSMDTGTPVADPQSSQRWLVNMGPDVPVDPATGLGPYEWAAKYVDDLFHLGRYPGTSVAPSLDGFFLDNVLIDPSCANTNFEDGDWTRNGKAQAHNAPSTYSAVMAGEKSFYSYLNTAWPGSLQLGNAGTTFGEALSGYYKDATLTSQILAGASPLSGVMQGGDLEHVIGKTYSIEYFSGALALQAWYRTAMGNFGGAKLMLFSQGNVQANGSDPLTFDSSQRPEKYSPAWQGMRYGITAALMNDGYYFADSGTYDEETDAKRRWFDEYDNAGAGVGYLGQPVKGGAGGPQMGAWSNGVWKREFQNGIVLWNPKGNGTKTVNVSGLVSPSGKTGLKHIAGTQDPAVNNGRAADSVTLQDRDGVILLWTRP
jgi:hypothetical protein